MQIVDAPGPIFSIGRLELWWYGREEQCVDCAIELAQEPFRWAEEQAYEVGFDAGLDAAEAHYASERY